MRDFKYFLWQMSGASPFAYRRREFVRQATASRPCVALARASLWLLLADDFFWQKQWCARCFHVCVGFVKCALIYFCENRSRFVSSCYRVAFLWCSWVKIRKQRRRRAFSIFFYAFARLVLCFNPREGSTNNYHLVAATIPEDRLRAEERYPRWKSGFSLGHFGTTLTAFSLASIRWKIDSAMQTFIVYSSSTAPSSPTSFTS